MEPRIGTNNRRRSVSIDERERLDAEEAARKVAAAAAERFRQRLAKREAYSKIKNERERATFTMMMKMNPEALTAIRKEFYMREDAVKVEEFVYLINKHLMSSSDSHEQVFSLESKEQR